ncbi:MAG: Septum formation initiator [Candidatus Moranbacteria bacterium GW2011_GWE1_35_17]|nr:MAG: Septum formation initiator [Candidatus Moranbacteria bacterium GW2011_GWE1_35_17]KKP84447.1 MAG: Septum formation initiator [Candidatus Moranbacteria bacterium GW2011_GWF1_35_5]
MKIFYFLSFSAVLLGVLAFFSIPALKEIRRSKIIENEISSLELEAENLNAQNNFLKEKIEYLKSDYYKESVAKDRLSLRNLGEKLVVVHPSQKVLGASDKLAEADEAKNEEDKYQHNLPNYEKWWSVVKGK